MSKEEAGIPKATVTKVIKENIPSDIRISKETTDILVEGCVEFVNMMAAEANNLCSKQNKKTIAPEHVIQALESLGLPQFINEVKEVQESVKAEAQWKSSRSKNLKNLDSEQLRQQQERLFQAAKKDSQMI